MHTDEIFDCPQGFGRILDVSDLKNPEVAKGERPANVVLLSTFRVSHVQDQFDHEKREFVCPHKGGPPGTLSNTTHLPCAGPALAEPGLRHLVRRRRARAGHLEPVRAHVRRALSCRRALPRRTAIDRHTREIFQDPDTHLLYVTDGNGGGLMVLRYTGPLPERRPIPGGR